MKSKEEILAEIKKSNKVSHGHDWNRLQARTDKNEIEEEKFLNLVFQESAKYEALKWVLDLDEEEFIKLV